MKAKLVSISVAASLVSLSCSAALAATPEDCQRAVDEVSIVGRANYDSATEAQLTKYLNAASTALVQKGGKVQATKEIQAYQQKLDEAVNAQKVKQGDAAKLKEASNKALQCINSL
ncbi:MAG: hypothetical protein JNN31_02285 [Dechloromonas sp.]|nr:hypothetical protein [Dechloromonas sp.]